MNKPKNKGTAAESAVVKYMRINGYPGADRQPLRGNRDAGDILLCPGVVLEIKAHKTAGTGQPGAIQLAQWMAQAATERHNAGAALCPLIVKRTGTANVAAWWAYLPFQDIADLIGSTVHLESPPTTAPICMAVGSLVALLRSAGYGDAPEQVAS
jgi:hypothetical protein